MSISAELKYRRLRTSKKYFIIITIVWFNFFRDPHAFNRIVILQISRVLEIIQKIFLLSTFFLMNINGKWMIEEITAKQQYA